MRLYWKNTASDGLWSTVANWYEDASATVPHGSAPVSGDSVSYATGETAPLTIDMTVDLGAGVCNIAGIQVGTISDPASGVIAGGTFTGNSLYLAGNHGQFGSIFGGVFTGDGYNLSGYVYGGLFTGHDHSDDASQAGIFGGIFTGAKFWHNGRIAGGAGDQRL